MLPLLRFFPVAFRSAARPPPRAGQAGTPPPAPAPAGFVFFRVFRPSLLAGVCVASPQATPLCVPDVAARFASRQVRLGALFTAPAKMGGERMQCRLHSWLPANCRWARSLTTPSGACTPRFPMPPVHPLAFPAPASSGCARFHPLPDSLLVDPCRVSANATGWLGVSGSAAPSLGSRWRLQKWYITVRPGG